MLTSIEKANIIIIYDLANLAYLTYFSQAYKNLETSDNTSTSVVYGSLMKLISQLKNLVSKNEKAALIFALDEFPEHKREIVSSYKMNREKLPEDEDPKPKLLSLVQHTKSYLARVKKQEADDVMASLTTKFKNKQVIIVTSDQDLLQLKSSNVDIYATNRNEFFTLEFFMEKYGLTEWKKLPIYKACFGDNSDNIKPALPRVRKKDVLPTINECDGTLKGFASCFIESKQTPRAVEVFQENIQNLKNNYKIVKLNKKLIVEMKRNTPSMDKLKEICRHNEINSIDEKDLGVLL
jgi:5'-3' exonuclease